MLNTYTSNENLMDYDFILSHNKKHNFYKKRIQRKTHKKQKSKSFWKRQNDKKGNQKYYKTQNKKIISIQRDIMM